MEHTSSPSIGTLFEQAIALWCKHWRIFLTISGCLLGSGYLLLSAIPMQLVATPLGGTYAYEFAVNGDMTLMFLHSVLQIIIAILGVWTTAALFLQTRAIIDHHHPLPWKQSIMDAGVLLFDLLSTTILQMIFLFILFLLLLIPGIIFMVYRVFTVYVVIHYQKKRKSALDESKRIVQGRRWKTLGYMFVLYLPMIIVTLLLQWGLKLSYGLWGWAFFPDLVHNGIMMVMQTFYGALATLFFLARDRSRQTTAATTTHHTPPHQHHA